MNAKELITLVEEWKAGTISMAGMDQMTEHILATVREDDDELIDSSYANEKFLNISPTLWKLQHKFGLNLNRGAWIVITRGGEEIAKIKTRGQLRKLLESLEVK